MDQKNNLYKMYRFKLGNFIDGELTINERELRKQETLVRESELIRIINHLRPENKKNKVGRFTLIPDIIAVTVKEVAYKESKGKLKVHITKTNKFENNKTEEELIATHQYTRLLASSGNVRNRKIIFIKEDLWEKVHDILLCGMPKDMEFEFLSKFNAYYALASTDSISVSMPRILVIDDFKHDIEETFDLVKEEKKGYEVVLNDNRKIEIKPFDGAGLVSIQMAEKWAEELGLDYTPSSFQFRAIAGLKGVLNTFDIETYACEQAKDKTTIKGIWNNEQHDIWDENGKLAFDAILTKSQFKFFKQYLNLNHWKTCFEEELYEYKRTFNICKVAPKYEDIKHKVLLSYQPLQSLNLNQEQIKKLCKDTMKEVRKISTDVDSFLKFRGLVIESSEEQDEEYEEQHKVPEFYKALMKNKELFNDDYIQKKVKNDIKKFKEKTFMGSIFINGNYQMLVPDLVALAEYAFGKDVVGCLKENEVYSKYWVEQGKEKISIIRFPHIAMEHKISTVVDPNNKYLDFLTEGIMISIKDSTALKLNGGDFDGDRILSNCSEELISQAENEMANTIIFVPLEKEQSNEPKLLPRINEVNELIQTDINGMKNDIGTVVNSISKLWSMPQNEVTKEYIQVMSIIGALTIDFAKSGIAAEIPVEIKNYLKSVKKPYFLRYKYKSQKNKEAKINRNSNILKKSPVSKFNSYDSTMNRLCWHMEKELKKIEGIKKKGDFDFTKLLLNKEMNIRNKSYPKVLDTLIKLQAEYYEIVKRISSSEEIDFTDDKNERNDYTYTIFFDYCETELLKLCMDLKDLNEDKLIDYIIYVFYCEKNFGETIDGKFVLYNQDKSILWNIFGEVLKARLNGTKVERENSSEDQLEEKKQKLQKRSEKLNTKIVKIKEERKKVYIKIFEDNKDEKEKAGSINIFQSEINRINKIDGGTNRKVALTLLALQKFCLMYKLDFKIYSGKKYMINKNHIIRLAKIDSRYYEKIMQDLIASEFIKLQPYHKNMAILECEVQHLEEDTPIGKINDINECSKYMKLIK